MSSLKADMTELEEYSKELGLVFPATVSTLISSHRFIRAWMREQQSSNADKRGNIKQELEKMEQEYLAGLPGKYVSLDKLKGMTLEEIAGLLK